MSIYVRAQQQIPTETQACRILRAQEALMTTPCDWLNFLFVCRRLAAILFIWDKKKKKKVSQVCACVSVCVCVEEPVRLCTQQAIFANLTQLEKASTAVCVG